MDSLAETALRPGYRGTLGLVLTGGGARSAYQVGVLLALAELWPRSRNPFQIIVGTSAGGVAAGVLAAEAHQWRRAVAGLERVWANFRSSQVFHVDSRHMLRAGAHWVLALMSGGLVLAPPRSMLDNTPLRELLGTHVDCAGIRRSIERGHLRAFALCSTSYGTGHSVAFFDGVDSIPDWARVQRVGCRTQLGVDHVMASAAIPLLFPPIRIGEEYFGDGAMRQLHPLSPAIHLGADRLLIIGVRARRAAGVTVNRHQSVMPTPGEIFGYMLDTLFTDQIYADLEQLERINTLVHSAPEAARGERRSARDRRPPRAGDAAGTAGSAARDRRARHLELPARELPHVRGRLHPRSHRARVSRRHGGARRHHRLHEWREAADGHDRRRGRAGDLSQR